MKKKYREKSLLTLGYNAPIVDRIRDELEEVVPEHVGGNAGPGPNVAALVLNKTALPSGFTRKYIYVGLTEIQLLNLIRQATTELDLLRRRRLHEPCTGAPPP